MRDRLVAALARPMSGGPGGGLSGASKNPSILDMFKKKPVARSVGAALLADDASANANTAITLDWTARARILFDTVDIYGSGAVGVDDCARLVRDVLDGAAGVGTGGKGEAISDFLRDLAEEGEDVRAGAVAEEVDEMMKFAASTAEPKMLHFAEFASWLSHFMDSIEAEEGLAENNMTGEEGGGGEQEDQEEEEGYTEEDSLREPDDSAEVLSIPPSKVGFSGLFLERK